MIAQEKLEFEIGVGIFSKIYHGVKAHKLLTKEKEK
jgi:hypothetical protein